MNIYTVIVLGIFLFILLWRISRGWKNGFAKELDKAISIVIAVIVVWLIANCIKVFTEFYLMKLVYLLILLSAVFLIYKLIDLLLKSLKLFSKLPVIGFLDKLLGIATGIAEGVMIDLLILTALGRG